MPTRSSWAPPKAPVSPSRGRKTPTACGPVMPAARAPAGAAPRPTTRPISGTRSSPGMTSQRSTPISSRGVIPSTTIRISSDARRRWCPCRLPVRISDNDVVNTHNMWIEIDEDGLPDPRCQRRLHSDPESRYQLGRQRWVAPLWLHGRRPLGLGRQCLARRRQRDLDSRQWRNPVPVHESTG